MEVENGSEDDLEVAVFIAALASNDESMKYVTQFLSPEDVEIITGMVMRSKSSVDTNGFLEWMSTKVVTLVEREKERLGIRVLH